VATEPDDRILPLASSVSDGSPIDWEGAARATTSEQEREAIRQLRLIAEIGRVHAQDHFAAAPVAKVGAEQQWKHLLVRERLGAGTFGEVFKAWDPSLGREVALKLLDPGKLRGGDGDPTGFLAEGIRLAKVRHPHVIAVYGADVGDGRPGIWMELIHGRTLEEMVARDGPLSGREASLVGLDLCRALTAIHQVALVHRDVKATNVMRERGGRIVLMDFGATRELSVLEGALHPSLAGTPFYMPPDILEGEAATPKSDIYGLGVLLFHLVTGRYPVEGSTLEELRAAHRRRDAGLLRHFRSDLPEPFVRVVETALEFDPAARPSTAAHMERALTASLGAGGLATPHLEPASSLQYLQSLGDLLRLSGRGAEALETLTAGLRATEKVFGADHPKASEYLLSLGLLYEDLGNTQMAESSLRRALEIEEKEPRRGDVGTSTVRHAYAALLRKLGREAEAMALEQRRP
jgi:eukaryotic-like serine/threonine-protein kinase